jgi:predicted RNA methylase
MSDQYWTPLPVIQRAAAWLRETQVRTVVDIGSGAGKFCVATAILAPCRFIGLEQRSSLVDSARSLAELFDVDDRVTFLRGDVGLTPTPVGDAYYLFNPFGTYAFDSARFAEPGVGFSAETYARDVRAVTRTLSLAPYGTIAITYNGFGGKMPERYEQIDEDLTAPRALRLWRKRGHRILQRGTRPGLHWSM